MKIILPQKEFMMLRHGETTANAAGVLSGSQDVALTEKGIAQATFAQNIVRQLKPTIIVHSHRTRAINTAKITNQSLNLPMIEDPRFAEQNFGDWEGQPVTEIRPYILSGEDPPNGESNEEFSQRFIEGLNDHLKTNESPILFVGHGGLWRAFTHHYGQAPVKPGNCEPWKFSPNASNPTFPWEMKKIEAPKKRQFALEM